MNTSRALFGTLLFIAASGTAACAGPTEGSEAEDVATASSALSSAGVPAGVDIREVASVIAPKLRERLGNAKAGNQTSFSSIPRPTDDGFSVELFVQRREVFDADPGVTTRIEASVNFFMKYDGRVNGIDTYSCRSVEARVRRISDPHNRRIDYGLDAFNLDATTLKQKNQRVVYFDTAAMGKTARAAIERNLHVVARPNGMRQTFLELEMAPVALEEQGRRFGYRLENGSGRNTQGATFFVTVAGPEDNTLPNGKARVSCTRDTSVGASGAFAGAAGAELCANVTKELTAAWTLP